MARLGPGSGFRSLGFLESVSREATTACCNPRDIELQTRITDPVSVFHRTDMASNAPLRFVTR